MRPLARNALDERGQVGEAGRRREPELVGVVADHVQQPPGLGQRPAAGVGDVGQHLLGAVRVVRTRSCAAAVCTTMALTEWAITSCSSRAIRSRSARTASWRTSSCCPRAAALVGQPAHDPAEHVRRHDQGERRRRRPTSRGCGCRRARSRRAAGRRSVSTPTSPRRSAIQRARSRSRPPRTGSAWPARRAAGRATASASRTTAAPCAATSGYWRRNTSSPAATSRQRTPYPASRRRAARASSAAPSDQRARRAAARRSHVSDAQPGHPSEARADRGRSSVKPGVEPGPAARWTTRAPARS